MPPYAYLGVIGGFVALGVFIYTIFTQNQNQNNHRYGYRKENLNLDPGYDKPRDTWDGDDSKRRRQKQRTCAICMDDTSSEKFIHLPCKGKHTYHHKCVAQWLKEKPHCPECREWVGTFVFQAPPAISIINKNY